MAISGAHLIVYSADADADRAFLRDVLEFPNVDAGHGWLIFKLPPAEAAVHPADSANGQELYLMCDDLESTLTKLRDRGVTFEEPAEAGWGRVSRFRLPGGSDIGIYQPRHPRATEL